MMMKKLYVLRTILLIFISLISIQSYSQKLTASDKLKLFDGDDNFMKEYYEPAYKIYKELHSRYPENADINYKLGKTSYLLGKYDEALTFLTQAVKIKPKIGKDGELWLGRAQHMEGMFDESLKNYELYRSTLKGKKASSNIVNEYIEQVKNAKTLMSLPVNVTISNMGDAINTEYKESNPSITADGHTFIFTSCRPGNTGGLIDPNFGIYYQDVWISEKDTNTGKWQDAELIPGEINTNEHDACLSISPDGGIIFVYRSVKGGDIFYSKRKKNGDWRAPKPLEGKVNTTYFETSACMTSNKKKMFFISERIGKGLGNGDIWVANKSGSFEYDEPTNLGKNINTIDDENSLFLHPDGKTLYFSSNSKNSIGGYDIFKTELKEDGSWTKPVNLGYPINTLGDEVHFVITADGTRGYLTAKREDSKGDLDIYEINLENYRVPNLEGNEGSNTISSGEPVSILRGKVLSKMDGEALEGKIEIKDENGKTVEEIETHETGDFFAILEGNKNYTIEVKVKEYKDQTISVFLPRTPGKTEIVTKAIFLEEE